MKPCYSVLKSGHYSSSQGNSSFKKAEDIYTGIGYNFSTIQLQNSQFRNTCAVRMNFALLNAA
ncbi:MAG: hypothetical protein FWD67_01090 [Betaproteobacteria bacterium]|nr:hypothetical protein [Betaproteobacteria bacterium]